MLRKRNQIWTCFVLVCGFLIVGAFQRVDAGPVNLIKNGSFEYNPLAGCKVGTTIVHKWIVTAGNVDVGNANCWGIPAAVGEFWLDLTGSATTANDVGTIAQNVPTIVGHKYRLSFYFGGNPQCMDEAVKSMQVRLNGAVVRKYSINVEGVATNDAQWHRQSIVFTAKTSSTALSFQSLKGVNQFTVCGALIDGVYIVGI